jgi:hypothetical protein
MKRISCRVTRLPGITVTKSPSEPISCRIANCPISCRFPTVYGPHDPFLSDSERKMAEEEGLAADGRCCALALRAPHLHSRNSLRRPPVDLRPRLISSRCLACIAYWLLVRSVTIAFGD